MSTEERYARATRSSHLEVEADQSGDIDSIIAAGGAASGTEGSLGVLLARVRAEWDGQSGELALYLAAQREWRKKADEAARLAQARPEQAQERLKDLAYCLSQAKREGITGRAMVMIGMPTLRQAREALLTFAEQMAPRHKVDHEDKIPFRELLGNVLDVWIDRKCHHCAGRGFNGGYREPQVHCRPCRGTGNRRMGQLSEDPALHAFGLHLLTRMDAKSTGAMGHISRKTRSNG